MRKAHLIVFTLLFCLGSFFTSHAAMQDRGPCIKACKDIHKTDRAHCKTLKGKARSECMKAAKDLFKTCKDACPKGEDDEG